MRNLLLLVAVLLSGIVCLGAEQASRIEDAADLYVARFKNSDFDGVAELTHPLFVAKMGGREAYIETMRKSVERLRSQGVTITAVLKGEASAPQECTNVIVSFVPMTVEMKSSTHRVTMFSHLLGISGDMGKTWSFVDLASMTDEQARELFPSLVRNVIFPERKEAVVEQAELGSPSNAG